jgi:hypothetical protein
VALQPAVNIVPLSLSCASLHRAVTNNALWYRSTPPSHLPTSLLPSAWRRSVACSANSHPSFHYIPAATACLFSLTQLLYILESNPHPFYSCRGLKGQTRIRIECGLDSRSRAGVWPTDRAGVRAVRTIQGGKNGVRIRFENIRYIWFFE